MNRQQNKMIKLLEKIVEQNKQIIEGMQYRGLGNPWLKPYSPWIGSWPEDHGKNIPPYPNTIPCPYCDKDTGIPQHLTMSIPAGGLKCTHCNRIVVNGSPTITCKQPFSTEAISAGQQADFDNRLGG